MKLTHWEALQSDPEYKAFIQSRGWRESEWNLTKPWERTAERVEFNGGLDKTGILRELPGAIKETVVEQGRAVASVATSTGRTIRQTSVWAVVGLTALALIVYHRPITKAIGE